jgi:hypothetical protein
MTIPKPVRIISASAFTGLATSLIVRFSHKLWLIVLFIPIYFVFENIISRVDIWLRRTTKDQLWLWSYEGREWLKTPKGEAWKKKTGYRR